jgi:hypothetical protein
MCLASKELLPCYLGRAGIAPVTPVTFGPVRRELVTSRLDLWSRHANNSSVRRGLRQAHLPRIVYAVYQAGTLALSADSLCGLTIGRAVLKQHTEYPNEDSPPKLPIKLLRIFLLDPIGHPGPAPGLRSKEEFPLPVWRP